MWMPVGLSCGHIFCAECVFQAVGIKSWSRPLREVCHLMLSCTALPLVLVQNQHHVATGSPAHVWWPLAIDGCSPTWARHFSGRCFRMFRRRRRAPSAASAMCSGRCWSSRSLAPSSASSACCHHSISDMPLFME